MRFAPLSQYFRDIDQMSKSNLQIKMLLLQRLDPHIGGCTAVVGSEDQGILYSVGIITDERQARIV
jgi:hypothetical protein